MFELTGTIHSAVSDKNANGCPVVVWVKDPKTGKMLGSAVMDRQNWNTFFYFHAENGKFPEDLTVTIKGEDEWNAGITCNTPFCEFCTVEG